MEILNKPLVHLHLPKTGGQDLAFRIGSSFMNDEVSILNDIFDTDDFNKIANGKSFVEGHFFCNALENYPPSRIICTVRNPIRQLISRYYHIKNNSRDFFYLPLVNLGYKRFFAEYKNEFINHQVKLFNLALGLNTGALPKFDLQSVNALVDDGINLVPTEYIDDFIQNFALLNKLNCIESTYRINKGNYGHEAEDVLNFIVDMPELYDQDLLMYNYVVKNYRKKTINKQLDEINKDTVFFDRGQVIKLLDGWYPSELDSLGNGAWSRAKQYQNIAFRKANSTKILSFDVVILCGIANDDIVLTSFDDCVYLNYNKMHISNSVCRFVVDVSLLPNIFQLKIYSKVNEFFYPALMDQKSDDYLPKSYKATNFCLE